MVTAILIKDIPCRNTLAHFTHVPYQYEILLCHQQSDSVFSLPHLDCETAVIGNIRFAEQG
jgi:hypothetical protein